MLDVFCLILDTVKLTAEFMYYKYDFGIVQLDHETVLVQNNH